MNSTVQLARDPKLPTGPTLVAPLSTAPRTAAPGEWTPTDRWAWPAGLPVSGIARAVAGCIARHANNKTGVGWPGMGTIAKETAFKRTAVIAAIKELERGRARHGDPLQGRQKEHGKSVSTPSDGWCYRRTRGGGRWGGGSASDGPESVSIKSVKNRTSAARASCPICKRTWPAKDGTVCYQCDDRPQRLSSTAIPEPDTEQTSKPDEYRGSRIRNCPQCHAYERGYDDTCQSCDWTREAWEARESS